jgi:copper chaperone NosL
VTRRTTSIVGLAATLWALGACENADAPLEPAWGKVACSSCSMLVSDRRFAAELVTEPGAHLFFDDPGCMASWLSEHGERARHAWVRTADGGWATTQVGRFTSGAKTPLDFGFQTASDGAVDWNSVRAAARKRLAARGER